MAIFRNGALVGAISGSLGGVTFVAGQGSPVVRLRPAKNHKTSTLASGQNARFHNAQKHWAGLTALQRLNWDTYAQTFAATDALGVQRAMTGFRMYLRNALTKRLPVSTLPDDPPNLGIDAGPATLSAAFTVGGPYNVSYTHGSGGPNFNTWIFGYPFFKDYITRDVPRFRFVRFQFGSGTTLDIETEWLEVWGAIQDGQQFAVGVAIQFGSTIRSRIRTVRALATT